MNFGFFLIMMFVVLVIAVVAVMNMRKPASKKGDANNVDQWLFIEYAPTKMSGLEIRGFTAASSVQDELLVAGRELLKKLPPDIGADLKSPVSGNLATLFSQSSNPNNLAPDEVVAAVAVAEASLALWALMSRFDCRVKPPHPHPVIFDESAGNFIVSQKSYSVCYVIGRISFSAGVSLAMATFMWEGIAQILKEGKVPIPGLKVNKDILIVSKVDVTEKK